MPCCHGAKLEQKFLNIPIETNICEVYDFVLCLVSKETYRFGQCTSLPPSPYSAARGGGTFHRGGLTLVLTWLKADRGGGGVS